ncbi:MAG: ABC transporter ATP-binding protein [Candidatus Rokuibacteriota bacterium]|nr:MAG: ABC transporter ATP-binding protein [Candidatus Rokubacteria bacterium]
MLEINDLHAGYGESTVVQGVTLRVEDGQIAAVLGRNGVGKTTLIRAIAGLTPPRRGRVVLNGQDITRLPAHEIARRGVSLVPQGRRLFPSLDVREHLLVGARAARGRRWDLARVLDLFPTLRQRLRHPGGKLSGGEQGMLASGRALVGNPHILLMDEPSEGLAPLLVRELGRIMAELKRDGVSILVVEQNLAFALRAADHVYLMSKGAIVHECAPDELKRDDATKARYLGV